jgi:hypothetical protein
MTLRDHLSTIGLAALCSGLLLTAACGSSQDSTAKPAEKQEAKPPEPKKPEPPPPPKEDGYVETICDEDEIFTCYEQLKYNGNVDGSVVVDIATDGAIGSVTYAGSAPKPIQDCIVGKIKGKPKLEGFEGAPLQVTCGYSGSLNNGMRMTMWSPSYQRMPKAAGQ